LKTFQAVCTFRQDLIRRARTGVAFLATHPNGFAGISAATLATTVRNEQRTVASLQALECKGQSS
jgi:hypothetical protein